MKKDTTISVTIATVNAPSSLFKSLKGYFNQTLKPLEIIVVCSSQSFTKIAKFLKDNKKAHLVKLIKFDGNKSDARNIGFSKSSGNFIIYADDDMIPRKNLIKECSEVADNFDVIIIPEEGNSDKSFFSKIHRLEKEIVKADNNALTPRLFKRSLFKNNEMPFEKKFGVLDEWGFFLKLKSRKPKIGTVDSYFTVKDGLGLKERFHKNLSKGLWAPILIREDTNEGLRRINPLRRGLVVYINNIKYFKQQPFIFSCLVLIKFIDLLSFIVGYSLNLFNVTALKGTYVKKDN